MKKLKKINVFMIALTVLCFCALPAFAGNIVVDGEADLNSGGIVEPIYTTIQAAVDGSVSGDTVTVKTGTYRENVKISGKSLTFVAEGEVILTVPEPDFAPTGYAEWDYDLPDMTSPVVSVDRGSADNVQISFTGFNFEAPDLETAQEGYLVSAGIFAGAGTSLTVKDCGFNGAFMVPVLATTYEDVFNDMNFDDFTYESLSESAPASLDMSGCTVENYVLAGVSLVGPNVTGVIINNNFTGMVTMEDFLDFGPAMAVDSFRSAFASGTLFSKGLGAQSSGYFAIGGAGVLLLNSSGGDGESEDVTLTGNTITKNLLGIGILKDFRVEDLSDQIQEDLEPTTVISGNVSIGGNLVGIAVIGGFDEPLVWSRDHGITIDDIEGWDFSSGSRTRVDIASEEYIVGNMVGVMLLGGVEAHVDSCAFTDNYLAGLVALGDLNGSVISNNEFSGTVGVNLLYGLGSSFWNMFAPRGAIEMEYAVSITGNRFIGNGLIEGAHEFIRDFVEGEGEGEPLSVLSSMGTRIASGGPLAFLPSDTVSPWDTEGAPTLAGIVLLDGASYVKIEDNLVTDSLLGVTAMDLGLDHILYEISEGDIEVYFDSAGIFDVLIQNNEITGNLSGLNLLGARELIGIIIEEEFGGKSLSSSLKYSGGLEYFSVRANTITDNHFGVINGLDVQALKFSGNSVDNNLVLGMLNAGMGVWAFEEVFGSSDYYHRGPIPSGEIFGNSFSYNGTVDGDLDDLPIGTETLGTYVKGGVAVFDVPDYDFAVGDFSGSSAPSAGISLNRNTIQGNGNYGLLVVGRVGELRYVSTDLVSTDLWFDATENFWGDVTGPSSYFGEDSEVVFSDPMTAESADKAGDAISGVVFEEDGQYYPYDFIERALYVRPLNCIRFDEWLGEDGDDVQAVVGAKISGGETSRVGRDLGNGNRVDTTVIAGENGFDWTLTRLGSKPADSSALKVSAGGYYRLDVTYPGNVEDLRIRFSYSSSSAPDFYWFDRLAGEWIKLVPSSTGKGYLEFTFNRETNPTLEQLFDYMDIPAGSFGPSADNSKPALFAQSATSGSSGSGGGGGGCNVAYVGLPAMALLLPLLALMLRK